MNPQDSSTLRDELEVMLAKMYYSYSIIRDKERKRRWAVNLVTLMTALFFVVGLFLIRQQYGRPITLPESLLHKAFPVYFPLTGFVVWAGFMGGFMSLIVRLVSIPTKGDEETLLAELETVIKTLYASPVIGAIFALLLYLALAAQLLTGSFFPTLAPLKTSNVTTSSQPKKAASNTNELSKTSAPASSASPGRGKVKITPASGPAKALPPEKAAPQVEVQASNRDYELNLIRKDLNEVLPQDGKNFALLLVWCFIAGYAQTFVPDKLKAITSKAGKSGS
jgi:hypothetical protein